MPIRNPFRKPALPNSPPTELDRPGSYRRSGRESDRSSLETTSTKSRDEPDEYQLSVIEDGRVYLPPSPPPEKTAFWSRSHSSRGSSNYRNNLAENAPFSISRESFESYRRSFDISARSPVLPSEGFGARHSIDSRMPPSPKSRRLDQSVDRQPVPEEEAFEDVGLAEDVKPKKRSIFPRFIAGSDASTSAASAGYHHGFSFAGRKRGLSGQGAELHNIPRPVSTATEIQVET
ncbi:MAG: hypothetical protein M1826_006982 [Phylliscum demangeonii]|nr:MAG: hypothetical protein M1826_006982 [Phylliscum demangeonii]